MAVRLVELHRILKPTGSLYLHCDPKASHYLKIVLDRIFGEVQFRNELIWGYNRFSRLGPAFPSMHDTILFYAKTQDSVFNKLSTQAKNSERYEKGYHTVVDRGVNKLLVYDANKAVEKIEEAQKQQRPIKHTQASAPALGSVWNDIAILNPRSKERLNYSTQKPLALLERILTASSKKGDLVLDPFCGCGTTVAAAEKLHRQWIGIDITYSSIAAIRERFRRDRIDIWPQIEILDTPTTVQQVDEKLLNQTSPLFARKEFEKFCVATIGGLPNDKMGADGGIDGRIPLMSVPERAICSVKSGQVGVAQLRDLKGLLGVHRHDVAGVFISRHRPTNPMQAFANQAGLHHPTETGLFQIDPFPRLQILTLEQILNGKRPNVPYAKAA